MNRLLADAAARAARYVDAIGERRVPALDTGRLAELGGPLPEGPTDPEAVLRLLDDAGSPATLASTGPRYFGFVTGGALPAAMAASWLGAAWDQNAAFRVMSPVAATLEDVALGWLKDLLHLPASAGAGFVTGATMANFTGLAAARHHLLARADWNVGEQGLFGAPGIKVVVGDEVHVSLLKALSMLGLGTKRVIRVPVDGQGRMIAAKLPPLDAMTIVAIQAGNVNTGAFDPAADICRVAHEAGAWVHVDGAFGLWAAAAPSRAHLTAGVEEADSWATDCHKWLNVGYDSGLALVREPAHLRGAMGYAAAYLDAGAMREPSHYTPEASRRARGIEVWAALRSLGRSGLAELVERNCRLASRFAEGLPGFVLNDVVLNQVLVKATPEIVAAVQNEGTCWMGSTVWQGHSAMRISVSNWSTTEADVDRSIAVLRKALAA